METGDISVRHADELKQTYINNYEEDKEIQDTITENVQTDPGSGTHQTKLDNDSHAYKMKLRSHSKQVSTCTIENFSETEFYEYVDQILDELNIDLFLLQVKMTQVVYMFLAIVALATAWDPVRPGALVKKVGDMIIVDQSVRFTEL